MSVLATDNFNRTESPLSDGGQWTNLEFSFAAISGTSLQYSAGNSGNDCSARRSGTTWPNDHYSKLKVTAGSSSVAGNGKGVTVRFDTGGATTYYRLVINKNGAWELGKKIAGTFTSLLTGTATYSAGAYLELDVQGTTLTVLYNGVSQGTKTDASISSGQAGIGYSSADVGATGDDWEGGDLAATSSPVTSFVQLPNNRVGPMALRRDTNRPTQSWDGQVFIPPILAYSSPIILPNHRVGPMALRILWNGPAWTWDGPVAPPYPAPDTAPAQVRLPNNRVGPMALRQLWRGPLPPMDGQVAPPYPAPDSSPTQVLLPNNRVGPMALRQMWRGTLQSWDGPLASVPSGLPYVKLLGGLPYVAPIVRGNDQVRVW